MIVPPRVLYEIRDLETGVPFYCYPVQPLDLRSLFAAGARSDAGYEIHGGGQFVARLTPAGELTTSTA